MKKIIPILLILFFVFQSVSNAFAQKIRETAFELGLNKTLSPEYWRHWDSATPAFLFVNGSQSWFNEDHRVSLRKGLGLSVQYANIDLSGGGLGGGTHTTGHIYSLFLNPELMAHMKVGPLIAVELGPAFEYLIVGSNKLNNAWWMRDLGSGNIKISGMNRDYFNQPLYGFKARFLNTLSTQKRNIGITFSYLWTKSEDSDFYAKNYFRISFLIGLRKSKGTTIELDNELKEMQPNQ